VDGRLASRPGRRTRLTTAAAVTGLVSGMALAAGGPAGAATQAGGHAARPAGRGATAGVISTVAGGVGGPGRATQVPLSHPCAVVSAPGGLYVSDLTSVRKVSPRDWLTTPAGTGTGGFSGIGGPATAAGWFGCGVARDHHGNLVIAATFDGQILVAAKTTGTFYGQAMTAGHIYSVAGGGHAGGARSGEPATEANLILPRGVSVDSAGNLVFAVNLRIRVVAERTGTFYGQAMKAGDIYSVAGDGSAVYSGNGGPATQAGMNRPQDVAIDHAGNLLIADTDDQRIRVVASHTGTFYGQAMKAEHIYTLAGSSTHIGFSGDGGPAIDAELARPMAVAVDQTGNVIIADSRNSRVRVVAEHTGTFYGLAMTAGDIYTIAGDGSSGHYVNGAPAIGSKLRDPDGVAVDDAGNVVIADGGDSRLWVVAHSTGTFYGRAMTAGHIYIAAGNRAAGLAGGGRAATTVELDPGAGGSMVSTDSAGNVVIANRNQILVEARSTGTFYGRRMAAGHIYVVAGTGAFGYSGDGGPATKATFDDPWDVTPDHAGNLVIADFINSRVRVVAARTGTFYGRAMTAGDVYTVAGNGHFGFSGDGGPATAAELDAPAGVAVDSAGNLLIADRDNERVRVVAARTGTDYGRAMTAGDIYTVAGDGTGGYSGDGGPGTKAELGFTLDSVAADGAGNTVIADGGNNRIRVVAARTGTFYGVAMKAGDIYTVVGTGKAGHSGDGGPATAARLSFPAGVAVDGAGNLVIADSGNNRVRVVAHSTGTFYGVAMKAGDIFTVAGTGKIGFAGDGGPAIAARLDDPSGVAPQIGGSLVINDAGNSRYREVTG
jgi:trimeric autotransporter adhesin